MERGSKQSPGELVRQNLNALLMEGVPFNGQMVAAALDMLQQALLTEVSPADLFPELASLSSRAAQRAQASGKLSFAQAFGIKADNFKRTAEIFRTQAPQMSQVDRTEAITAGETTRAPRAQAPRPTNTEALPPMSSKKI
ncbi:hypothetical protein A3A49_01075 [Candidatus Curtissbacteria bacterium RIFCSPLOWO2_01_FULL_38_11b]|uniref:Uncharacterized protein n=1 Tax=Candidatus Curtissbacteria bacterium RIFCSPLOWO2_01_FULL_38_11b TaxID=1797725 RepID=A0A1F5H183_9BACT|nr:MAG: hypothetical protein A3A49_01075 [Candidatus Curtissbacteria bacterium RIFCSPLOWO2_01_FULL_38_11b]